MEIFALDLSDKWIQVNDKVKFRVDYLEPDQTYKLQILVKRGIDFKLDYKSVEDSEDIIEYYNKLLDKLTEEQKAKFYAILDLHAKVYLKYVIKDWSGMFDKQGREVKCVLVNNELEDNLWKILCNQSELVMFLYDEAKNKILRWNEIDKKKLHFSEGSGSKGVSRGRK